MKRISRRWPLSGALLAGAAALPALASAQTTPTSFTVTSIVESTAGKLVSQEALSLQGTGTGLRLRLASANGSTLSQPVTLTAQGEIAADSQDAAVTCYNMAVNVLRGQQHPGSEPASVFVRFGNSIVPVELALSAIQTQGDARRMTLTGTSSGVFSNGTAAVNAGIAINAVIDETGGTLRGASFDEVHYLGASDHIVVRSTCIMSHSALAATARV